MWAFSVNGRDLLFGQAMYNLFTLLTGSCGWVAKGSGDGTGGHFSATDGTALTNGGHGAFGFFNVGSWIRLQSPTTGINGQKREFIFQCGSGTNGTWSLRTKYSPNVTGSTGFTGGSPSATRVPSATDEIVIWGDGTDASPTYASWGGAGNNDHYFSCHIMADSDGDDGYCWAICGEPGYQSPVPSFGCMAMDIMRQGTFDPSDPDPMVLYMNAGSGNGYNIDLTGGSSCHALVGPYTGQANSWQGVVLTGPAGWYATGTDFWSGTSGDDRCFIPYWKRTSSPYSDKGLSSLFLASMQIRQNFTIMSTSPGNGGDRLYVGYVLLPWPPNTPCIHP
jgi:hypothetical protein